MMTRNEYFEELDANARTRSKQSLNNARDFGTHSVEGPNGVILQCEYVAPGLTMQDIVSAYQRGIDAAQPGDDLAGNPARWPLMRGLTNVVDLLVKAFDTDGGICPTISDDNKNDTPKP
jgi:hypothetical protein